MDDRSKRTVNRTVGIAWLIVGVGGLVLAAAREPIADWGTWNLVMGGVLAFLGIVGLYVTITGRGTFVDSGRSNQNPRTRRTLAVVAIVAIGLALVLQLANGPLTTGDILSVGIWLGLIASMIAILVETNAELAEQH